jgi:subtilisin
VHSGVNVCIVDTGMDYYHQDLAPNYLGGYDFVNNDNDPMDDNGHGTAIAGIIAAADNPYDVIGVAPLAKLTVAKVLDAHGNGAFSDVIAGIDYCVSSGAQVINLSLNGNVNNALVLDALQSARDAGVFIVAAAGNGHHDLSDQPVYPAAYNGTVFTVSAAWVREHKRRQGDLFNYADFSNFGIVIDLTAPGVRIISDLWQPPQVQDNGGMLHGGLVFMSGTSLAAPHVAGAAALYLWANPGASPDEVQDAITSTAEFPFHDHGHHWGELKHDLLRHTEGLLDVRGFDQ